MVLVTMKKAEEVEVESSYVDSFRIDSSQSQRSNNSQSPPRRCKKWRSEERQAVGSDNNDYYDNDNDRGGKQGEGYGGSGGSGRGVGKCRTGF